MSDSASKWDERETTSDIKNRSEMQYEYINEYITNRINSVPGQLLQVPKEHTYTVSCDPCNNQSSNTSWPKQANSEDGKKDSKGKLNYELDWDFITQMAQRTAENKDKYVPYNWKNKIDLEELKQATMRHLLEVMKGYYEDGGRQHGHLEAIALNCQYINYQLKNYPQKK
jgi:hypothetical protein